MGKRLTRIATRTGDDGTTGLGDGSRVAKTAPRITALGDVDELNSTLGVLAAERLPEPVAAALLRQLHAVVTTGAVWDATIATHGSRRTPLEVPAAA